MAECTGSQLGLSLCAGEIYDDVTSLHSECCGQAADFATPRSNLLAGTKGTAGGTPEGTSEGTFIHWKASVSEEKFEGKKGR